ncbi:PLC-like phosphodiesterase [Pterulicium gracile]|uniref:PLC-like phosphodiesterase n=1 Tax=Pterulicium gracile TaxID=1884261 RepID=A0A5C3QAP7_9AGAR|nr:PLC-like phosphodiesterase [Pterula gracilis]
MHVRGPTRSASSRGEMDAFGRSLVSLSFHDRDMQLPSPVTASREDPKSAALANDALHEILNRGTPILGQIQDGTCSGKLCDWQKQFPDDTKLVYMNLPGTHDAATWNYTKELQESLFRYTGSDIPPSDYLRCQEHSFFQQLNRGIRVFDWRLSYNPGNDTIGFFHGPALLAPTTRVEDVLYGFYRWLDLHPSEALLISIKYEDGPGRVYDAEFQQKLYNVLDSDVAKRYWVQTNGVLGALGEARGKLTLLQRSPWSLLPNIPSNSNRFGIHLREDLWIVNGANITLPYNPADGQIAYIEDYYDPAEAASTGDSIDLKYQATVAHLERAATLEPDQLFITFASARLLTLSPAVTPKIMAVGDGSSLPGVNDQLRDWLRTHKGRRRGIVLLDFFDSTPSLLEEILDL